MKWYNPSYYCKRLADNAYLRGQDVREKLKEAPEKQSSQTTRQMMVARTTGDRGGDGK